MQLVMANFKELSWQMQGKVKGEEKKSLNKLISFELNVFSTTK
jgi:hypothetical protein